MYPNLEIRDLRTDQEVAADKYVNDGKRFTSFDQLQVYGVMIDSSKGYDLAPDGALVWACVGFFVRPGIAAIMVRTEDINKNPVSGIRVIHTWPNTDPEHPVPLMSPDDIIKPDFTYNNNHRGVAEFTNASGDWGIPIQDYIPADGSKFREWVMLPTHTDEPAYADMVQGCGMWGGTSHTAVSPIFRLVRKQGGGPGPTPDPGPQPLPTDGGVFVAILANGVMIGKVDIEDLEAVDQLQAYLVHELGTWNF